MTDERALALKVLERLPYDPFLRGKVSFQIVAWDKPGAGTPMQATMTPQEAIVEGLPKPSECNIVVTVFWSRMGTLLPADWVKPEALRYLSGSEFELLDARYLSGTEWEYFDALQAAEACGRPKVLVYRRTEKQTLDQDDSEFDEKRKQWKLVNAFFNSCRNSDGSLRRGYNEYTAPTDFEENLEHDLREMIKTLLEEPEKLPLAGKTSSESSELPLWQGSPFPGLRPFTDQDAPIFFGRGRESDGLIRKLADPSNRFIAVVGASGSGKSSLVWAGLIPRLRGQAVPVSNDKHRIGAIPGSQDWVWVRFTPGEVGDNPFMALATSLRPTLDRHGETPRDVAAALQSDSHELDQWVMRTLAGKPDWAELLLFVDQFEELFTLVSSNYQKEFVDLLARAITLDRVRTVVTMRADFYHRCLEWPVLRAQFENEQWEKSHFPLMAPGMGQFHQMITRPAERTELSFEKDLPERILNDTGTEPGSLALMAFALAELYEAKTGDRRLTHAAYQGFGGVDGAIGKRADDTFGALKPAVQAKLGDVFRDLVEVEERGVATRRRAPLSQVTVSNEANELVSALTDARLLVTGHGEGGESIVEVAHEALFRSWPRLKKWVQDTADDHRLRRHITQLAAYWQEHGFKEEYRWPDDRVNEAINMMAHLGLKPESFPELERDFLGPLDRDRMLEEIDDSTTPHERRAIIGVRLSLLGDPRPGVGLRKDGLPDIVWREIPGGEITLEVKDEQPSRFVRWLNRLAPPTYKVEPFYMAKYPVTWIQYRPFLDDPDGFSNPAWWDGLLFQVSKPGKQFQKYDNHPAENVSWLEAIAYCRWLGARLGYEVRLPTEWEWQQAATGGDPLNEYPWGPDWDGNRANTYECELSRSTAVGMYPDGASPGGVLDMAGNVLEWGLNEVGRPDRTDLGGGAGRVRRGGSWAYGAVYCRSAFRSYWHDPGNRGNLLGFRLARRA